MTVIENGIHITQVDEEAICQGYKLAFPENEREINDWLLASDEYADW